GGARFTLKRHFVKVHTSLSNRGSGVGTRTRFKPRLRARRINKNKLRPTRVQQQHTASFSQKYNGMHHSLSQHVPHAIAAAAMFNETPTHVHHHREGILVTPHPSPVCARRPFFPSGLSIPNIFCTTIPPPEILHVSSGLPPGTSIATLFPFSKI
ncbi:unnamed protein product, partial [Ectocarpus sp. 13 AM-2016]